MTLVAWVESGILKVTLFGSFSYFGEALTLTGPHPNPTTAMNANPACEAANPELAWVDDFVWLVWQERCVGQNWRIVMRALH